MLVVMMDQQLLSPTTVCPTCLMADRDGNPRWHHGQLRCGKRLVNSENGHPAQYECQMGFRIAHVDSVA
ncbi:MAG: hypothetical protein ACFB0C_11960 [Leptolyngbyaceae cyanobacterium]